jgi:hypothetical protein
MRGRKLFLSIIREKLCRCLARTWAFLASPVIQVCQLLAIARWLAQRTKLFARKLGACSGEIRVTAVMSRSRV